MSFEDDIKQLKSDLADQIHQMSVEILETLHATGLEKANACIILGQIMLLEGGVMIGAACSIGDDKAIDIIKDCLAKYRHEGDKKHAEMIRRN